MTWNVELTDLFIQIGTGTIWYKTGTMTTTTSCLERYRLDIIAVQEVRWEGYVSIVTWSHNFIQWWRKALKCRFHN